MLLSEFLFILIFGNVCFSIYVLGETANKKTLQSMGIKSIGWQDPEKQNQIIMHHNYSRVLNQNENVSRHNPDNVITYKDLPRILMISMLKNNSKPKSAKGEREDVNDEFESPQEFPSRNNFQQENFDDSTESVEQQIEDFGTTSTDEEAEFIYTKKPGKTLLKPSAHLLPPNYSRNYPETSPHTINPKFPPGRNLKLEENDNEQEETSTESFEQQNEPKITLNNGVKGRNVNKPLTHLSPPKISSNKQKKFPEITTELYENQNYNFDAKNEFLQNQNTLEMPVTYLLPPRNKNELIQNQNVGNTLATPVTYLLPPKNKNGLIKNQNAGDIMATPVTYLLPPKYQSRRSKQFSSPFKSSNDEGFFSETLNQFPTASYGFVPNNPNSWNQVPTNPKTSSNTNCDNQYNQCSDVKTDDSLHNHCSETACSIPHKIQTVMKAEKHNLDSSSAFAKELKEEVVPSFTDDELEVSGTSIYETSIKKAPVAYQKCPKMATGQFVYALSCNQFLNCWKGRGFVQNCAAGTMFNPKTLECDFAHKVKCITGSRSDDVVTENIRVDRSGKIQTGCPQGFSGVIPHYDNCSKFISCVNGKENLEECPSGRMFSIKNNNCDHPVKAECAPWLKISNTNQFNQDQLKINGRRPSYLYSTHLEPPKTFMEAPCIQQKCIPSPNTQNYVHQIDYNQNPTHSLNSQGISRTSNGYSGSYTPASSSHTYTYQRGIDYQSNNSPQCPEGASGLHPHPSDCSKFLNCANGQAFIQDCGPGTLFNPVLKVCDHPYNVRCVNHGQNSHIQITNTQNIGPRESSAQNWQGTRQVVTPNWQEVINAQNWQDDCLKPECNPSESKITNTQINHSRQNKNYFNLQGRYPYQNSYSSQTYTSSNVPLPEQPKVHIQYKGQSNQRIPSRNAVPNTYMTSYKPVIESGYSTTNFSQNNRPQHRRVYYNNNLHVPHGTTPPIYEGYPGYNERNLQQIHRDLQPPYPGAQVKPTHDFGDYQISEISQKNPWQTNINSRSTPSLQPLPLDVSGRKDKDSCISKSLWCNVDQICIPSSMICDGSQDCSDGKDEENCERYINNFNMIPNAKLGVHPKEKFLNTTLPFCAKLCTEMEGFDCKSFCHRSDNGGVCLLTDTNIGLSGALIPSSAYNYYESKEHIIDCSNKFICKNQKCIDYNQICDGVNDCGGREDEKGCSKEDLEYDIKLSGAENPYEGRIEVKVFGKWGHICDDQFGLRDADVACKELGFEMGALEVKGNSYYAQDLDNNDTFYLMDDVSCLGNETSLRDCNFNGWGIHNCEAQEIVGIICKTPQEKCSDDFWQCATGQDCIPLTFVCDEVFDCKDQSDESIEHCNAPIEVRLSGGRSNREGRLEVKYHGKWGTVCDDDFNDDAAKVVCKSLGYYGRASAAKDGYFGPGEGPIWLDQVFCQGNESKLEECQHWSWGEHNCEHSEDVGVICNSYDNSGDERSAKFNDEVLTNYLSASVLPKRCGYRNDDIFLENDSIHERVVQGSKAKKGDYPWQASIRVKTKFKSSHWCGAVVISAKYVLTAAHCLDGYQKGSYTVVAGDYNVDLDEGTEQEAFIEEYYVHEQFRKGGKMNNDIALVKLKGRGFVLTKDVQPICLPEKDTEYIPWMNCTISGFGSTQSGKSAYSKNLMASWVPIQSEGVCKMPHVYGSAITDGMICAGYLDEGVDSCDGDSGGPLACLHEGYFSLYGITSWGQRCGRANKPGVYVKVAYYRDWIEKTMEKRSKT